MLDFYEVVKYVAAHTSELGVDPSRIAIAGESGGGYVCAGAMVKLASKGEAGLIKLAIPIIPMLDDFEYVSSRASMLQAESDGVGTMEKTWQAVGGPEFETRRSAGDPLLFPAKADAGLLAKMPPTIIWESEFDSFLTPATRWVFVSHDNLSPHVLGLPPS